jgi:cobalamin biosynthesis Mg chelatase CobN
MKRQIFALFMALILATATGLLAQSGGGSGGGANSGAVSGGSGSTGTTTGTVPPSQQVDQSGQPEHTGRPDVDVDTGKNANNGVLNMDVKRNGDADTKAGNNPNGNQMGTNTTDTTGSMSTGTTTTTTTGTTGTDTTTGSYNSDTTGTGSGVSGSRSMPRTASDMPLVGLLGALALAGALGLRSIR